MIIKRLELVNFQVIKNFSFDFGGGVYLVTGENELGKSTLLKAIGALLTGQRDDVLRNGEKKGFAQMVVGDDGDEYEVRLSYTEANPRGSLKITQKSTGMQTDNVSMLQKIFGYKDFDAVEFSRWSETAEGRRKQIKVVKSLLAPGVLARIEEIDARVAEMKEKRADLGREIKTFAGFVDTLAKQLQPGDLERYADPVDLTDLLASQQRAAQLIEKAKTVRAALAQRKEQLAGMRAWLDGYAQQAAEAHKQSDAKLEAARLAWEKAQQDHESELKSISDFYEQKVAEAKETAADCTRRKEAAEKWLEQYEAVNPEKMDVTAQLQQAEEHNRRHNLVCQYKEKKAQYDNLKGVESNANAALDEYAAERARLISDAKLPIDGLSFTDDGLVLNGVPFVPGKVSDSQCMEVAAKLIIAANPNVRVFRIARGESLGEKRLRAIVDMARRNGFQGFIECVQRGQNDMRVEEYTENPGLEGASCCE